MNSVLFLAIFFSTATQLRIADSFVGMSELLFTLYALNWCFVKNKIKKNNIAQSNLKSIYLLLLPMVLILYFVGSYQVFTGGDPVKIIVDFLPYVYSILIAYVVLDDMIKKEINFKIYINAYGASLFFLCMLSIADYFGVRIPSLILWLDGGDLFEINSRYIGWSKNPNQLAINTCSYIFVVIVLKLEKISDFRERYINLWVLSSLGILYLTKSTTLLVILLFLMVIYLNIKFGVVYWVVSIFLLVSVNYFFEYTKIVEFILDGTIHKGDGGLNGRAEIWANAIQAFMDRPIFGHGPGAHSGVFGPYEGIESHNVILDLATQTGFVGVFFYILFVIRIIYCSKDSSFLIYAPLISAIIYQISHFPLRHPIFLIGMTIPVILKAKKLNA
jgi:hypothetical protein